MEQKRAHTGPANPGMLAGLLGIGRGLLGLFINRIELASLELSEIGRNLVRFLLLFTLAAIALWFALAFWSVLLVYLAWEFWGWKILLVFGAVFTVAAAAFAWYACAFLHQAKLSLPETMAELRKDRDALL